MNSVSKDDSRRASASNIYTEQQTNRFHEIREKNIGSSLNSLKSSKNSNLNIEVNDKKINNFEINLHQGISNFANGDQWADSVLYNYRPIDFNKPTPKMTYRNETPFKQGHVSSSTIYPEFQQNNSGYLNQEFYREHGNYHVTPRHNSTSGELLKQEGHQLTQKARQHQQDENLKTSMDFYQMISDDESDKEKIIQYKINNI